MGNAITGTKMAAGESGGDSFLHELSTKFWNEDVWLPPNITWKDLRNTDRVQYAQISDLYIPIPLAFVFLAIRYVIERFILTPIGLANEIKIHKPKKAPFNPALEKAFRSSNKISHKQIQGLAKQLDWSERQVERWFRQRRQQDRPNTLKKFTESGWRFLYYLFAFIYGCVVLWDKPWFWDGNACWYSYPYHALTPGIWWYYMIELSFYWSLTFSQFFDIKRKDFFQMLVHHVITISLLAFSYACNLTRIGTLVLVIHDIADIPLEAAKMAKYVNKQRLCDSLFGFFTLTWFITRLGVYPYKIIYSTLIEAPTIVPMFPAYYIFNGLLIGLQVLHVIWSYMILRLALHALASGKLDKDVRSDDSEEAGSKTNSDIDGRNGVISSQLNKLTSSKDKDADIKKSVVT